VQLAILSLFGAEFELLRPLFARHFRDTSEMRDKNQNPGSEKSKNIPL